MIRAVDLAKTGFNFYHDGRMATSITVREYSFREIGISNYA